MTDSALSARDLSIGFRASRRPRTLLSNFSCTVGSGRIVCLLGPNGAGKSTLLRTLAGLQPPLSGEVWVGGRPLAGLSLHELATKRSVTTSDRQIALDLTVEQLIALGRHPYTDWRGRLAESDRAAVLDAVAALELQPLADRRLAELSDGERQRAFLARAMAQAAPLMLLDEPTAYLDVARRRRVFAMLRERSRSEGRTIVASTHDMEAALRFADVLWLLPPGGPMRVAAPADLLDGDALRATFGEAADERDLFLGDGDGI